MNKEEFIKEVKRLGVNITGDILEKLELYADFLLEYNAHTNLTAIRNKDDVYLKHFYDSLTIVKVIDLNNEKNLLDIGTGAGFPGMVLKIFFPNLNVTLLDSNNKKVKFLEQLVKKLNVDNLIVVNKRVEDIAHEYLNYFDIVTARAVSEMRVLTEISMPLVNVNKYFVAMKGSNNLEINNASNAINIMHGKIIKHECFNLPNAAGGRNIVLIQKLKETRENDLRSYEKIVKRPL